MAVLVLAFSGEASPAQGSELESAFLKCRAVEDSLLRLGCYDQLADGLQEAAGDPETPSEEPQPLSAWIVEKTANPMDDSVTVVASLAAIEGQGSLGGPVTLYLRCESGKTEAYILWHEFLGLSATVLTRFDDEQPSSRGWRLSTDRQGTFYPGNSVPFAAKLAASSRFVAQVTPVIGNRKTAVFELSGVKEAVSQVGVACSW